MSNEVIIQGQNVSLKGMLQIPAKAIGLVLFVHGSGSSRLSTRNQYVANALNRSNIATLLFDLLTAQEEAIDEYSREHRFDINLLTSRLLSATEWVMQQPQTQHLPLGYFGASTGAAAAIQAAAQKQNIKAIVSRGGRPDLAMQGLPSVSAPTLLIVGGNDEPVIEMNQNAMNLMHCVTKLIIIPGATHLFEEPGKLEEVARVASLWFNKYLQSN